MLCSTLPVAELHPMQSTSSLESSQSAGNDRVNSLVGYATHTAAGQKQTTLSERAKCSRLFAHNADSRVPMKLFHDLELFSQSLCM